MNYRSTILSLSCLLLLSCEQKTPPAIEGDSGKARATVRDSMRTTTMELPPPPDDEEWFTDPQFNMDSLYGRIIYPELLRKIDIEGRVVVQVLVDTNGRPTKTRVTESAHRLFNQPVIGAVMQTHFTPAYRLDNHRPVAVWITIPINFTMGY